MKKFLAGLAAGMLLAGIAIVVVSFTMVRLGERRPSVPDGATLFLRLEDSLPERPPMEIPLFGPPARATVRDTWEALRAAAEDSRVRALVLMPRGVDAGWGKLDEVRQGIAAFKKSGKPVIAFLRNPGTREYYLATAAGQIYMPPEDFLEVKGLRAELMFLRGGLDKLGVEFEIEHAGKYKDAGDMFTRTSMTPETREVLNAILDQLYGRMVSTIAGARGKSPEEVRALIDQGPFTPPRAKAAGLVDDLLFEDQALDALKQRLGQKELKKITHLDYGRALRADGKRIALIAGQGAILRGRGTGFGEEDGIRSEDFIKLLRQAGEDKSIRGAIVRVDSPGGDALASDDILREMKLLSKKKPLVISMSDVAASGGYYIAMTGDPVLAYPDTVTGSIGVLYGKLNLRGLYDKLGIRKESITRGRFAALDSDYQPLGPEGRAKLRESIEHVYATFLARVAEGRKKQPEAVRPLAEGRVWMGEQAKERGLVDALGGLDAAVEMIRERAGIGKDEKVRLVAYPGRRGLLDYLASRQSPSFLEERAARLLEGFDLRLWSGGGLMRVMPYVVAVR